MNGEHEHLPIKIVVTTEADLRPPHAGGGPRKDFGSRYADIRRTLLNEIDGLKQFYDRAFTESNLPAVARLRLSEDTIAKTHRPDYLLQDTCPIIGGEDFGELLVSVRPQGLARLKDFVARTTDSRLKSDIGKIKGIEPYTSEDVLGEWSVSQFKRLLREHEIRDLKFRLFTHRDRELDARLLHALEEMAGRYKLPAPIPLNYGAGIRLYRITLPAYEAFDELTHYVGTQSLSLFQYFTVSTQSTHLADLAPDQVPPPDPDRDYPIVGIIDSGTDPNNPQLQAWVVDRDEIDAPRVDQEATYAPSPPPAAEKPLRRNHQVQESSERFDPPCPCRPLHHHGSGGRWMTDPQVKAAHTQRSHFLSLLLEAGKKSIPARTQVALLSRQVAASLPLPVVVSDRKV